MDLFLRYFKLEIQDEKMDQNYLKLLQGGLGYTLLHRIAKKRKNYCGGIRSPTHPASQGGSGGAPDHSAIQLDGDMSSYSWS